MKKKYSISRKNLFWFVVVGLGLAFLTALDDYLTPPAIAQSGFFHVAPFALTWLALIMTFLGGGSSFVLENRKVKWIWGFFIPFGSPSIEDIRIYKGMMGGITRAPAIIVEYRSLFGIKRNLRMSIGMYTEPTVAKFLRDLHDLRPNIPMDAASKKLMGESSNA